MTFDTVRSVGLSLPEVEAAIKYDGSPVLKMRRSFLAGMAMHGSAEPDSLVVRSDFDDRARMIEDAPERYYVTDYYRRHPVVLVRLAALDEESLRDLLATSWRLTVLKTTGQKTTAGPGRKSGRRNSIADRAR